MHRIVTTLLVLWLIPAPSTAGDPEALAVYRDLLKRCETATSMEELLPILPAWNRERHEASDEASRKAKLERVCGATRDFGEIQFVRDETSATGSVLHLKSTWNDLPMTGKVTIVREDGALKVEEWLWATGG